MSFETKHAIFRIFVIAPYNVENAMLYNYGRSDYIHDLNQSGDFVNICDFLSNYGMSYSKYGIKSIFDNLSGYSNSSNFIPELTEDDQLFVFICGDAQNSSNNTRIILDGGSLLTIYTTMSLLIGSEI